MDTKQTRINNTLKHLNYDVFPAIYLFYRGRQIVKRHLIPLVHENLRMM